MVLPQPALPGHFREHSPWPPPQAALNTGAGKVAEPPRNRDTQKGLETPRLLLPEGHWTPWVLETWGAPRGGQPPTPAPQKSRKEERERGVLTGHIHESTVTLTGSSPSRGPSLEAGTGTHLRNKLLPR